MFDGRAFRSWSLVLVGGACFGMLFALVLALADVLTAGAGFALSRRVVLSGLAAFAGYVGVAWLLRRRQAGPRRHDG